MPSRISRAKIQQKLENEVSKLTLAGLSNTTGRDGCLVSIALTRPPRRLTRAVSANTGTRVIPLFSASSSPLLTRIALGNTGGRVRTTVLSNFLFRRARNV